MNYLVTKPVKSKGIAILLVLFFGPFGMFYSTITGGVIMIILVPFLLIVLSWLHLFYLFIPLLVVYVLACFVWAIIGVDNYNYKIEMESYYQQPQNQTSEVNYTVEYPVEIYSKKSNAVIYILLFLICVSWGIYFREDIATFFKSQKESIPLLKENHLSGKYICVDQCIYSSFEFKGESTVVISGFYVSEYKLDNEYVRIKTDKTDLLLRIVDSNTLVGEGFATGRFIKGSDTSKKS